MALVRIVRINLATIKYMNYGNIVLEMFIV
jgi:hypothetical protein